jgi:hypothetical protein
MGGALKTKSFAKSIIQTALATALMLAGAATISWAQNVKITPLGTHPGELCDRDRATIFEDPTGVRLIYDVGQSTTGADDPRLVNLHAVLLSHAHGDHIGDRKLKALGAGTCERPEVVPAGSHSMTAEIAAAKNAAVVMVADLSVFIGKKIEAITGKPTPACSQAGGATAVPVAAPCRSNLQLGGTHVIKAADAVRGVEITIVYAAHGNGLPLSLLDEAERKSLAANGLSVEPGPPGRLCHQVYQRAHRLPVGGYRHPQRDENDRARFPQGQSRFVQSRAERGDPGFRRVCGEPTHQAGGSHRHACERRRNFGRKAETELAHRRLHQAEQAPSAPRHKRQDDGVQRQREVRSGV